MKMSPEQLQCRLDKGMSIADICEIENRKVGELVQRAYKAGQQDALKEQPTYKGTVVYR
jgi:hypothetical protein